MTGLKNVGVFGTVSSLAGDQATDLLPMFTSILFSPLAPDRSPSSETPFRIFVSLRQRHRKSGEPLQYGKAAFTKELGRERLSARAECQGGRTVDLRSDERGQGGADVCCSRSDTNMSRERRDEHRLSGRSAREDESEAFDQTRRGAKDRKMRKGVVKSGFDHLLLHLGVTPSHGTNVEQKVVEATLDEQENLEQKRDLASERPN